MIGAAAAGAILGDNGGYWIGREFGFPIAYRFGRYGKVDQRRLKLGQYLFLKHGGKTCYSAGPWRSRAFAAFLAGVNHFNWERFFLFNAAGGIVWASIFTPAATSSARRSRTTPSQSGSPRWSSP